MQNAAVFARIHSEASKKLRKLVDLLTLEKVASQLEKHPTHIIAVITGRRTMRPETCEAVFALFEKTFPEKTKAEVVEASKSSLPSKPGRRPSISLSENDTARARAQLLCKHLGVKKVSALIGRSPNTVKCFVYGSTNISKEVYDKIMSIEVPPANEVTVKAPDKPKALKEPKPILEKQPAPPKPPKPIGYAHLDKWEGVLDKEQAKRIMFISKLLARKIARSRTSFNGFTVEDLEQAGIVRCVEMAKRFDPAKSRFNTYFNIHAQSGILDFLREIDTIPRSQRGKVKRGELHRDVHMVHLEDIFGNTNGKHSNTSRDEGFQVPFVDDSPKHHEDKELVKAIVERAHLSEDEEVVVEMFQHDFTMKDIGEMFGVSESRISQKLDEIIQKLTRAKNRLINRGDLLND